MKSLFEYLEYREYLKDHYEFNKQRYPFFSYRYIAGKTGLDASFYVKVLQKQLHISDKAVVALAAFLKLNKKETEYFRLLVRFNRVKQQDKSKQYFEKLIELREPRINTLDSAKYEFFNKWYYIAIRELLNCYRFSGDYRELAAKLNPPISVPDAKRAVELLERLSLIKKGSDGVYRLADQFVTTGESWNSIAIENFQKQAIALAGESIARIPKALRETSTVTVSISRKGFEAMKERLKEVRKELLEIARLDENPDGVYHVNFQVFPLTARGRGEESP
ncbi:MAG TPA: TIGR02147 family protein [Chitinivibrionales bacterium]|nr:TIGR02147 family protein [Chitinivibrionales bacterium]